MGQALPVLLAAMLVLTSTASAVTTRHLVVLQSRVWQVNLAGQITSFPYTFSRSYDVNTLGSTAPTPSPDGQWIAFGRFGTDYDIHLLDVKSGREHRITKFGQGPRRSYTYVDAVIVAWSPDSRRLLCAVAPGETTSEEDELAIPEAPYGFYLYDITSRKTQRVALPKGFQLRAWLPDGRFLGVLPAQRNHEEDKLVILQPGSRQEVAIRTSVGFPSQAQVTADGKWLEGVLSGKRRGNI
jgi:Tol biopolymer transport system component